MISSRSGSLRPSNRRHGNPMVAVAVLSGIGVIAVLTCVVIFINVAGLWPPLVVSILGTVAIAAGVWHVVGGKITAFVHEQLAPLAPGMQQRVILASFSISFAMLILAIVVIATILGYGPVLPVSFQQRAVANCAVDGKTWAWSEQGHSRCASSLFIIQQFERTFPELDLESINGSSYNQTSFATQVQITFLNPNDPNTYGTIVVQTPRPAGECAGYSLQVSATGAWYLLEVKPPCGSYTEIQHGFVALRAGQPVTLRIQIQRTTLQGFINGFSTTPEPIPLLPLGTDRVLGLLVKGVGQTSSSEVGFSNFVYQSPA